MNVQLRQFYIPLTDLAVIALPPEHSQMGAKDEGKALLLHCTLVPDSCLHTDVNTEISRFHGNHRLLGAAHATLAQPFVGWIRVETTTTQVCKYVCMCVYVCVCDV